VTSPDDPLHPERLKDKQRALRDSFPLPLTLRVHRALSSLRRADASGEDGDVRFILLWIGFNAAYAADLDRALEEEGGATGERDRFRAFFAALLRMDATHRIYDLIWTRFPHEIRLLLDNRYVFGPFWRFHNGEAGFGDWERRFAAGQAAVRYALRGHDTLTLLQILFDRLYVLRNQLVHGGATWNSAANRAQVRDGAALLGCLLPVFIDLMMDHPDEDWAMPNYPVVEE
jgi:hypothetical protein